MHRARTIAAALLALAPLAAGADTPTELPVRYTVEWPFLGGGDAYVLDVHQAEGLSAAVTRKPGEPKLHERAAQDGLDWPDEWAYFAGPRTGGRIAAYESDHASMLDNPDYLFLVEQPLQPFAVGETYAHGSRTWRTDNLEFGFRRGDADATVAGLEAKHYIATVRFDYIASDRDKAETFETRREFWFAPALPYSRLQLLHLDQHLFLNDPEGELAIAANHLNDAVLARLEPRMREAGMLVKTRITGGETPVVATIHDLEPAPELDTSAVAATPLLHSKAQYMALLEPLFGNSYLQDNGPESGSATLTLPTTGDQSAATAEGPAGFQITAAGDLALATTFQTPAGDSGYLMLVRPYNGRPGPGRYQVTGMRDDAALAELSADELSAFAERFQVVGLIEGEDRLIAFAGETAAGHVEITRSSEQTLAGKLALELEALLAHAEGETATLEISGQFEAAPADGLIQRPTAAAELLGKAE